MFAVIGQSAHFGCVQGIGGRQYHCRHGTTTYMQHWSLLYTDRLSSKGIQNMRAVALHSHVLPRYQVHDLRVLHVSAVWSDVRETFQEVRSSQYLVGQLDAIWVNCRCQMPFQWTQGCNSSAAHRRSRTLLSWCKSERGGVLNG